MACELRLHRQFKKDMERLKKAGWDMEKMQAFLMELRKSPPFPEGYGIHPLRGELEGTWDAHLAQNWVVFFRPMRTGVIEVMRTGTHAYLGISC